MLFVLGFTLAYCVLHLALMDLDCIYNVSARSAFYIIKVPMFNNCNKHGKMEPSWHWNPTSKFALCGDIEF